MKKNLSRLAVPTVRGIRGVRKVRRTVLPGGRSVRAGGSGNESKTRQSGV